MKIVVVGLGSMGNRRIRILRKLYPDFEITGVDSNPARAQEASRVHGIRTLSDLEEGLATGPNALFVCSSPQSHSAVFAKVDLAATHTFSELDLLTDGYPRLLEAEQQGARRHFLSSTPLFDAGTRFIEARCSGRRPVAYRYHVGQYLPDWHPWESYKDFFIGQRATNGCREILAIELPWLMLLFGEMEILRADARSLTHLDIDFPDTLSLTVRHQDGTLGQIVADVTCPHPVHDFEVYGEGVYLTWDGRPSGMRVWEPGGLRAVDLYEQFEQREGYTDFIIENPYFEETKAFIEGILDPARPYPYDYRRSSLLLAFIDSVETVARRNDV